MQHSEIRLIWSGTQWKIESSGPEHGMKPGAEFLIRLPAAVAAPHPAPLTIVPDPAVSNGDGKLLFPAGTWLYLPLNPVKNEDRAWSLWDAHRNEQHPSLAQKQTRPLIPILLEEDLRFAHAASRGLAACRCRIGDRVFVSLNQAASHALLEWTANDAATINVFDGVRFIHNKALARLRDQRSHVLDGDPLPENLEMDAGTPDLFE
jgi:hypothetical protein